MIRRSLLIATGFATALGGWLGLAGSTAWARPTPERRPMIRAMDLAGPDSDLPRGVDPGVFSAAQGGTTWFGGTVWAADSMRWEALQGQLWTFESGVGSSLVPPGGVVELSAPTRDWVNPYKLPGSHATLEGWIGFDNTFVNTPYFRRVSTQDPRWAGPACVGSAAGLGGAYSYWCGVFPDEANAECYGGGLGYGNSWVVCIERSFDYNGVGTISLGFSYRNDTEPDYDYTIVYVDTTGEGDRVEAASYTGASTGTALIVLSPGFQLPISAGPIRIQFCVLTDGAWSDQDGLYPTSCGAFAVDDISVSGGGDRPCRRFRGG